MDYTPDQRRRIITLESEVLAIRRDALVEKVKDLALTDEQYMDVRRQQHRAEQSIRDLAVAAHRSP